jgi:hypothetical protein
MFRPSKSTVICFALLAPLCLVVACNTQRTSSDDDANGSNECVGTFAGTYWGSTTGVVAAMLAQDGSFVGKFTAQPSGEVLDFTGTVSANGVISATTEEGITITGDLVWANCSASGSWGGAGLTGGWQAVRQ